MPDTAAKICFLCHQDCSDRPRVKDSRGRYLCKACDEARAGRPGAVAPADGFIPLEEAPPEPAARPALCPGCGQPMGGDICVHCGYDHRAGPAGAPAPTRPPDAAAPALRCRHCGYDMTGLRTFKCPECGRITTSRARRAADAAVPGYSLIRPVILIIVAIALTALLQFLVDRSGASFIRSMVGLAFKIPVLAFVYFTCGLIWIGFDMPWRHVLLRLAAVGAVTTLIGVPVAIIPFIFAQAGIMIFAYFALLARLLDMEVQDAILVASIAVAANLILVLAAIRAVI